METKQLFPVFEMPVIKATSKAEELKYKQSIYFDYDSGDFKQDGAHKVVIASGQEAYWQWCMKVVLTERYNRLAYSSDIGAEIESAIKEPDTEAVQSSLERTITEALMVNKHTEYVRDFEYTRESDGIRVSFTVKGRNLEEQNMSVLIAT